MRREEGHKGVNEGERGSQEKREGVRKGVSE